MRLRNIWEGIRFSDSSDITPDAIQNAKSKHTSTNRGGTRALGSGGLIDLFTNRPYHHTDIDTEEDLVRFEPLDKAVELPHVPLSKDKWLCHHLSCHW